MPRMNADLVCELSVASVTILCSSESLTLVTLLLCAIDCVNTQSIFDRDPYESRRTAL
jgi:hypothetical protein